MRLTHHFARLPLRCDVERLADELGTVRPDEWRPHPTGFVGNEAALLVTVGGEQNDDFAHAGRLAATPLLERLPYVRRIMTALASPISRSRFMRLAPGQRVPWHDDVGWHWFERIRVHVPVVTDPGVIFHCGDDAVHMPAGEVWIFDNFEPHCVVNDSAVTRVHLVIDIVPGADFFALAERGVAGAEPEPVPPLADGASVGPVPIESFTRRPPSPAKLAGLVADISADLDRLQLSARHRSGVTDALGVLAAAGDDFDAFRRAARRVVRLVGPALLRAGGAEAWACIGFLSGLSVGTTPGATAVRVLAELEQTTVAHAEMGMRDVVRALGLAAGLEWSIRHRLRRQPASSAAEVGG